ncbi:MAG: hypothetical protein ABFS39_16155 [Pseudomonadota bacterium]
MRNHSGIHHPRHCFCQIPESELLYWLKKRYLEQIPTVHLLDSTDDLHEKEVISIVSMLDVDEATMLELMGDVEMPEHHIMHCRENLKKLLGLNSPLREK